MVNLNENDVKPLFKLLPPRGQLMRGLWISVALWVLFLIVTAYSSAATLLDRVGSTDVMRAATDGIWSGKVVWEIAGFVTVLLLLHLCFAFVTWLLACASAIVSARYREKLLGMVVGWFSVLAAATLAYNALWYPRTLIGAYYHFAMEMRIGTWPLGKCVYYVAFAMCAWITLSAGAVLLRTMEPAQRKRSLASVAVVILLIVAGAVAPAIQPRVAAAANTSHPHVIILGIDSLRLEQLRRFGGSGATPNLDRFLATADVFPDTTTPAARTFSSWVAILSGRAPTETGARFNLADRASVQANPTIGDVLRKVGYRTVYSTDEVRFANIDETYGFDEVVTPRIGASDFLLGSYNELPLASMFINTRLGKWLFPFSYSNRGVATMFEPETFVDRIKQEVSFDQPTLFISHLTAAHWPYYTSDVPFGTPFSTPDDENSLYRVGLRTADHMFGELLAVLEAKGALRNALVIVLSDHGEAFGLPSDSFFDTTFHVDGLRAPLKMLDYGHGQSVLSKAQYQILLSFRTFGSTHEKIGGQGRDFKFPATAEDISPTILNFLGIDGDPLSATGRSLLPMIQDNATTASLVSERIRFTETDLAVLPGPAGGVDEAATARQNAIFFEVDHESARLRIRPLFAPLALSYKERAAYTTSLLLAAMPAGPYAHQYLLLDFPKKRGYLLLGRPGADEPDAQRLWDAMSQHYGGELKTPVATTREDWPRIGDEWRNLISDRRQTQTTEGNQLAAEAN